MISQELTIHCSGAGLREPVAWLIPGAEPVSWLHEIVRWGIPQVGLRILPLPTSMNNQHPTGALVLVQQPLPAQPSPSCLGYGLAVGRLYLPVDAGFTPPISEVELANLLPAHRTSVWHPTAGLIAFEKHDELRLADLLQPLPEQPCDWGKAVPGVAFARRLTSVLPEEDFSANAIIERGRGDIGTNAGSPGDLPPTPTETGSSGIPGVSDLGRWAAAKVAKWLHDHAPQGTANDGPTWMDKLGVWANQTLSQLPAALQSQRQREIDRLMHLLQTDPDRGLQFALPMSGAAHRGQAPPSNRLGRRNVDFNLNHLGGGGPADYWDIDAEHQIALHLRYRELANREIRLGRHRRAAYIFAELLGDHQAAATTLADGKHWREAAVLYDERLNMPAEAARCLENGGYFNEAIAIFERLEQFEKAGDLYARIGQEEESAAAYHAAVAHFQHLGRRIEAARILDEKLHSADLALLELAAGWPGSPEAGQCLSGVFRIQARLGRHAASSEWITGLREELLDSRQMSAAVGVLTDTAAQYPDRDVRHLAEDTVRVIASRRLPAANKKGRQVLVDAVGKLASADLLLTHDCQRYLRRHDEVPQKKLPRPSRTATIQRVRRIRLKHAIEWQTAVVLGNTIYAAGLVDDGLVLQRCNWEGDVESISLHWPLDEILGIDRVLLRAGSPSANKLLIHACGRHALIPQKYVANSDFPDEVNVTGLPVSGRKAVAADWSAGGVLWVVESYGSDLTLSATGVHSGLISKQTVAFGQNWPAPLPFHVERKKAFLALEHILCIAQQGHDPQRVEFDQPIITLAATAPNVRFRLAIGFDIGGTVYWDGFADVPSQRFGQELATPVLGFNRANYLIAADREQLEVYSTQDATLQLLGQFQRGQNAPVAVLAAPRADQFGILARNGELLVYQVNEPHR